MSDHKFKDIIIPLKSVIDVLLPLIRTPAMEEVRRQLLAGSLLVLFDLLCCSQIVDTTFQVLRAIIALTFTNVLSQQAIGRDASRTVVTAGTGSATGLSTSPKSIGSRTL